LRRKKIRSLPSRKKKETRYLLKEAEKKVLQLFLLWTGIEKKCRAAGREKNNTEAEEKEETALHLGKKGEARKIWDTSKEK